MAQHLNFLLGNGHRLTAGISIERPVIPGPAPYSFSESKARLGPQIAQTAQELAQLPDAACPDDYAVGLITMHPEYTAKSYFPATLLREARLESIGSRPGRVQPAKWKKKKEPEEVQTTQLFVAGRRGDFSTLAKDLPRWTDSQSGANQLFEIEAIRPLRSEDRLHPVTEREPLLEIVLHTTGVPNPRRILEAFEAYARSLDLKPDLDRRFEVGGLCFSAHAHGASSCLRLANSRFSAPPARCPAFVHFSH